MATLLKLATLILCAVELTWSLPHQPATTSATTPTLPLSSIAASNTGSKALPEPTGEPVVIALGLGTQNYTCNSSGSWIQTGSSTGAIATLFNVTSYLSRHSQEVSQLPVTYLNRFESQCAAHTNCLTEDLQCEQRVNSGLLDFAVLGEHFFNSQGIPTFNLYDASPNALYLNAAKDGDVKAPVAGAVGWLYLEYNGTGVSEGISSVYRVETVGGVALSSCTYSGASADYTEIPYAAEYWFYD